MSWDSVIRDDEQGGNIVKIQQHGLTIDGRLIVVVYEEIDEFTIRPVTAWADRENDA